MKLWPSFWPTPTNPKTNAPKAYAPTFKEAKIHTISKAIIRAHEIGGTAPTVIFSTNMTGEELASDDALCAIIDGALAGTGYARDYTKGAFAPGGIAGVKAPEDENTPRTLGQGCIFLTSA